MSDINVTIDGATDPGGAYRTVTSITADHTAETAEVVLADASGGAVTVTLPGPAAADLVTVKKTDSSSNGVTIATPNSETIDGQSSLTLSAQYASREVTSDGTDYFTI